VFLCTIATIYSPGYASLADLSIAARQRGENINSIFSFWGREKGDGNFNLKRLVILSVAKNFLQQA